MQMKNWMLTLLIIAGSLIAGAQNTDTPAYQKNPTVPELYLIQVDSSTFTRANLKQQPTLIMYFSPTCDHCQHQWADMVQHKDKLKDIQIIMATYQPFEEMADFYKKEKIAGSWPNVHLGRDTQFKLVPFYRMRSLPYQALYDRNGKLITTFEGNVKVEKMLEAFNGK
jgi:thioredoxin-related protein